MTVIPLIFNCHKIPENICGTLKNKNGYGINFPELESSHGFNDNWEVNSGNFVGIQNAKNPKNNLCIRAIKITILIVFKP